MSGSSFAGAPGTKNFWTRIPLSVRILIGVGLGIIVGTLLGSAHSGGGEIAPWRSKLLANLKDISSIFIELLKALATPLIFFAVIDALVRTHIPPRQGAKLLGFSALNATVAIVIGLGIANTLHTGDHWRNNLDTLNASVKSATGGNSEEMFKKFQKDAEKAKDAKLDILEQIKDWIPKNFVDGFQGNKIISVVLMAIFFGAALRTLGAHATPETERGLKLIADGVQTMLHVFMVLLGWVIEIIPLAIFGVVSQVVGVTGIGVFTSLGYFLGTIVLGLCLHAGLYYCFLLIVVGRASPLKFFAGASEAIVTALSCGSSLATLPVTLRCLKYKLRVTDANARLAACVGTNFNHDGIILYEAAATIFVAQALGIEMTFAQQIQVALVSILAGIGIAGVPEAGLISLNLVLVAAGIPAKDITTVLPLLLSVDWIIGRGRAATNVISDMTVATLLDRLDPQVEQNKAADAAAELAECGAPVEAAVETQPN